MALMKDHRGEVHDIVPDGVEALETLGWTKVEPADTAEDTDAKPTARRSTRSRPKAE